MRALALLIVVGVIVGMDPGDARCDEARTECCCPTPPAHDDPSFERTCCCIDEAEAPAEDERPQAERPAREVPVEVGAWFVGVAPVVVVVERVVEARGPPPPRTLFALRTLMLC